MVVAWREGWALGLGREETAQIRGFPERQSPQRVLQCPVQTNLNFLLPAVRIYVPVQTSSTCCSGLISYFPSTVYPEQISLVCILQPSNARNLTCKCPSSPSSFMQADGLSYSSMVSVYQPRDDPRSKHRQKFSSWVRRSTHPRRWFCALPSLLQEYTKCFNVLRECVPHAPVQNAPNNPETMSKSSRLLVSSRPASYCPNRLTEYRDPNLPQGKWSRSFFRSS